LGLDLGTTATRASLASPDCNNNNKHPDIVSRPDNLEHRERYGDGDFPSAADFFAVNKAPKLCIGYIGDDPDQTPIKIYPYICRITAMRNRRSYEDKNKAKVSDEDKEFENKYRSMIPQLERFFDRFDALDKDAQSGVMKHARKVLLAHLGLIRWKSDLRAASRGWKVTQVVATIPPNWDRWTQHLYIRVLKRVWKHLGSEEAITLLHESEAIGHWLLGFDERTREKRPKRLILADFGGHTLVCIHGACSVGLTLAVWSGDEVEFWLTFRFPRVTTCSTSTIAKMTRTNFPSLRFRLTIV
jgi:hypothetical protein